MAVTLQLINVGALPNDGTGDSIRGAFLKVNADLQTLASAINAASPNNASNITNGTLPLAQLPNLTQPVTPIAAAMAIIFGA
jgi:hypothetical protein